MTAVPDLKPETPTVCISCHEEYRYALQRIGEIEDAKPDTREVLELDMLKAAVAAYEAREVERAG
ncbi:hypothetical protein [Bosea sp. BIWAKO-01]|uniref:hypothetical protein n=1 Tax=Bosea sp. BIWAKO-01 TaxID=506668 RepID=UPI0008530490|nr:hypothetical protein [Bosea sp. BIWAKO-01]GAU86695.1 hypothetical protein BIWAKO_06643 [Bosea sp. BIWAKO-01]